MRDFARKRKALIKVIASRLDGDNFAKIRQMVRAYCKRQSIPATDSDIDDVVSEAIRRKMIEKVKTLQGQLVALHEKVKGYRPEP